MTRHDKHHRPTQAQLFYAASRAAGDRDATFMELVNHPTNPLTKEDLAANIARRPELWSRYAGYLDKLPHRAKPLIIESCPINRR